MKSIRDQTLMDVSEAMSDGFVENIDNSDSFVNRSRKRVFSVGADSQCKYPIYENSRNMYFTPLTIPL